MRKSVVVGVAAAAVLADTALWFSEAWMLSLDAEHWARHAQTHGWTVSSSRQSWGGWPFVASLTVDKAAISGGLRYLPGGLAWSADRVVASISIAHPFTLFIVADGQQFLRVAHAPDIGFVAGEAVARLPLGWTHHGRGTLELTDITGGIAGSRHPQDVQVGALSLSLDTDQAAAAGRPHLAARLNVQARSVGLPDIGRWPLGATVTSAGATVLLTSPLPERSHGDPETGGSPQAIAWRDGGGTVVLQDADLHWGPLVVAASANLVLDDRLQPAGTGIVEAQGTARALDSAARGGLIVPGLALTIKAVLAVMTHVQGPEGDAVRLPFLLRDSTVSIGQIPVTRLPDIRW